LNHRLSTTLRTKRFLKIKRFIIDRAGELISDIESPQLMVIIDLLYQRLCSEKVPGEFFPFRESMYHLLLNSKWVLKTEDLSCRKGG
jgi:hypothetical protein